MIVHSIAAARATGLFDSVVVTTDDEEIAQIAREAGAEIPFMRPAELANDTAVSVLALLHTLEGLATQGRTFDSLCMIYATAPFVRPSDIRKGFELLVANENAPCVLSVTDFDFPIFRALKMQADGSLQMFWPEYELTRSNDLPAAYHDAGQFSWLRTEIVLREKRQYFPGMLPLVLPRYRVQDIDTEDDWRRAEKIFLASQDDAD